MTCSRSTILLALLVGLAFGCDGEGPTLDAGPPDAASTLDASTDDAGPVPMDAAPLDASPTDAGATDAGASDAGATDAEASDAGASDAGLDATTPDACVPPPCPAPPVGCAYEGATLCECGTLVCEPAPCADACTAAEYCDLCATPTKCEVRPTPEDGLCPGVYSPVCGCDGMTYSNGCFLGLAGVSQLHAGECGGGSAS